MRFLAKRIGFYVLAAWAAVSLNFLIPHFLPGGPVEAALSRFQGQLSAQAATALAAEFGLGAHQGFLPQYWHYLDDVVHGNLGVSFTYFPEPVSTVIGQSLPWTVVMVGLAIIIAWCLGTLIGIVMGARRGSWIDGLLPGAAFIRGLPQFWIGLLAVGFLAIKLGWFPASGGYSASLATPSFTVAFIGSAIQHAILPVLCIVAGSMVGNMILMRNMMVTTLAEEYVQAAEAKGLPRSRVMFAYAARNAILPSVVSFALELGFTVSGALLVEEIFSYPGIGFVLFQAIGNEDYPLMQGIFLIITLAVLGANIIADLTLSVLDPRTRSGEDAR